ncbi:C39 family peptidase [Rhodococcus sovatensis]|uniref:C39 family peptidase n=1 Tax=Rhodococcus sovatensis TaxID=1805840 RepID=A0ABZ2PN46_9NOCA
MHEFDPTAMWPSDAADDVADGCVAEQATADYSDDSMAVAELIGASAGPHHEDQYQPEPVYTRPEPGAASAADSLATGNPALDIDLSDIDLSDTSGADSDSTEGASTPPGDADAVHGNPAQWTINWFYQQFDGYCGPAVVGQLVAEYTEADISDPRHLVDRAVELGLMAGDDPAGGMTLPDIEILLEDQGVPATISSGSLDDLRAALDNGQGVVAMVDSGEIWKPEHEGVEDNRPDHVLVVAGIDDARGVVILSDPGVPNGNQLEVPIEQFEQAWADSGNQMLVADDSDPDLVPADSDSTTTTPPVSDTRTARTTVISLRS